MGDEALEDIDSVELQTWLNALAKTRSGSAVKHCRIFLRSIFAEALEQGYLDKNPARLLKVPKLRTVKRPYLSIEEVKELLKAAKWATRDLTLLRLILTTGLRPSELFALRWKCINLVDGTLSLYETIYRGKSRSFTKTTEEGDVQQLVVPEQAVQALAEWHAACERNGEEDFIFPNSEGGFWFKENYQRRVLTPLAKQAGISHVNFQVLRRTVATWAASLGSLKDTQTIMRHRRMQTTQDNYVQVIAESVKATSEKLAEKMFTQ
jgi:integrase